MARRTKKPPEPARPPGRRSTVLDDPAKVELMVAAVQAGQPYSRAAALAGVPVRQFHAWMKRGREAIEAEVTHDELNEPGPFERDDPYQGFAERIIAASARGELRILSHVNKAAERDWRAGAWLLERRFPDEYTPARRLELAGNSDRPLSFVPAPAHPVNREAAAAEALDALAGLGLLPSNLGDAVESVNDDDA